METITIATAADDRYVFPMAVMMRSVALSLSAEARISFRILSAGLSRRSRQRLDKSLSGLSLDYEEVVVPAATLHDLKVDGHVTLETYFRLLMPQYLPNVEKVLYLDTDLVVRHSVHELFSEHLGDACLRAVPHASPRSGFFGAERGVPSYAVLGIPAATRTFNAGVLLLNLETWRRTDATHRVLEYLRNYRELVLWHDQDGMNAVLHDKWRPLAAKWNVMASHFADFRGWQDSLLDAETFESIRQDPGIVHYSNSPKPWSVDYRGPFLEHWHAASAPVSPYFVLP